METSLCIKSAQTVHTSRERVNLFILEPKKHYAEASGEWVAIPLIHLPS